MPSPTQEFTARNLAWARRFRRQFGLTPDNGKLPRKKEEWSEFLDALEARVAADNIGFEGLKSSRISKGGKTRVLVSTRSLDEVLVLRRMNENIRRAYGIKSPNKENLLRTLKQALSENVRKSILRVDIRSCFESISRKKVLDALKREGLVSYQTISLLDALFKRVDSLTPVVNRKGLPRGLAISATLAEIVLSEVEAQIRRLPGVYLVIRYVDDMVIVSSDVRSNLKRMVHDVLRQNRLRLNSAKTRSYVVACNCEPDCKHGHACPCLKSCVCGKQDQEVSYSLEYVGYSLMFDKRNNKDRSNEVQIRLSPAKVKKIKSRIFLATRDYIKSADIVLYEKRIKYLMSNFVVISGDGRRGLSTGLSYTHQAYNLPRQREVVEGGDFAALTDFVRAAIRYASNAHLHNRAKCLDMARYSFVSAFHSKRRMKLSAEDLTGIRSCWVYA